MFFSGRSPSLLFRSVLALPIWFTLGGFSFAQPFILPKGTYLSSLTVITESELSNGAQKVFIATLQGVLARRSSAQIYIDSGAGYSIWKDHLRDHYGIPYTRQSNPWLIALQFAPLVDGYILFNFTNANSLNVATSLCGPFNAVAIDQSIELTARLFGFTNMIADVRNRDEQWCWTNYNTLFSRSNLCEQAEWLQVHLRDYAPMINAFTFYDGNTAFRTNVISAMDSDAAVFGWGDASQGEDKFVTPSSKYGLFTIASDAAVNLSSLSSIRDSNIVQHTYATPAVESNVHYVAFVVTDGDNIQWDIGWFGPSYFNHPARGSFNMNWALSPSMADLAPSVMRWFYDNSSNGPNRDFFVAGVSGSGYMYPSLYPTNELALHLQKLNNFMARSDLNMVQILDFNSINRFDLWNQYFAQPTIDAVLYNEFAPYSGANGAVSFGTNGKPIIATRNMLWSGLEEETNVITSINAAPRDPSSALGYSLVAVHVWTKNMSNVNYVVTNLAPDVRVVTLDVFAKLIRDNVGRRLAYDFANGLQGWTGRKGSRTYDNAQWTNSEGGGVLMLDGTDLGTPNNTRNSYFFRHAVLPPNATALTFDTRASNDGKLRVRMHNYLGTTNTLLDWEILSTTNWVSRSVNISNFAGQTVTVFFEQNDGGQGINETRYVDNLVIQTASSPVYPPATPRMFTPIVGDQGVQLSWRVGDASAAQFHVERRSEAGDWSEIAAVWGTDTNFTDATWGGNFVYRVRGWNGGGFGPYSNERSATTPYRPVLSIKAQFQAVQLSWPAAASNFVLQASTNLSSPWLFVTNVASIQSGTYTVTIPVDRFSRFFRLVQ
jgi:hypothetical protein